MIVPPGYLRPADSVKLHWIGRDGFRVSSETRTVTDPVEPMQFNISRYEVIDAIGYQTTDVHYTIKRPPSADLIVSRHLNLTVTGQDFVINAPTIDETHETLSVRRQSQFSAATRVRVRAVGNTSWESSFKAFGTENALNFTISPEWIAANRGIPVVFNYSVQMDASSPDLLFSRILRVDELVTPVDIQVPFVEEAPVPENDAQQLNYYQHLDDIHVIVPVDYLRSGDTVKLYWIGRNGQWSPDIVTVADPVEPLSFQVSKYEVIDVIGLPNTDVRYSVRRPPSPGIVYSRHLKLRVTGHEPAILAPTINDAHNNIRVWRLQTFNDATTVTVRAIGISSWEGEEITVGSAEYVNTPIDPAWLAENRGTSVLFNYRVQFNPADPHAFFSLLLRIDSL
ncbi:hypothetical protein [Pseudomonas sp. NPDC090208]|uniref:hypothetical protein n=1 Tax=Pseudomonas sp. NPDC090208 TaxID=3364478 RepID=UPI00381F717A